MTDLEKILQIISKYYQEWEQDSSRMEILRPMINNP